MSEHTITIGGKERLEKTINLYSKAFQNDPVVTYIVNGFSDEQRAQFLPKWFKAMLTAAALNGASFDEIDGGDSISVLMHPGDKVDNPWTLVSAGLFSMAYHTGWTGCKKMLFEYPGKAEAAKHKAIGKQPHFYVFFVATSAEAQGKGLASKLLLHYQEIAAATGLPLWLEATTDRSRRIYDKLGFETLEEVKLGPGKVGTDGKPLKDGPGVSSWMMVWRPPVTKTDGSMSKVEHSASSAGSYVFYIMASIFLLSAILFQLGHFPLRFRV